MYSRLIEGNNAFNAMSETNFPECHALKGNTTVYGGYLVFQGAIAEQWDNYKYSYDIYYMGCAMHVFTDAFLNKSSSNSVFKNPFPWEGIILLPGGTGWPESDANNVENATRKMYNELLLCRTSVEVKNLIDRWAKTYTALTGIIGWGFPLDMSYNNLKFKAMKARVLLITCFAAVIAAASLLGGCKKDKKPSDPSAKLESVALYPERFSLYAGSSNVLELTVKPAAYVPVSPARYVSSNTDILTVSSTGQVNGLRAGQATVTVDVDGVSATCTVDVVDRLPGENPDPNAATSLTIRPAVLSLQVGMTLSYIVTVTPETADISGLVWSSDKETVATVDQTGKMVAVGKGSTHIRATLGNLMAISNVWVD